VREEIKSDGTRQYVCEECGFVYRDRKWAEKCEEWCSTYHGCNLEITQHAVKSDQ